MPVTRLKKTKAPVKRVVRRVKATTKTTTAKKPVRKRTTTKPKSQTVKFRNATMTISRPSHSWYADEPKKEERIALYQQCPKCILIPPKTADKLNPKSYKFPICTKLSKSNSKCQVNCRGVLAANRRARLTKKYPGVVKLTSTLLKKWTCTKKAQKAKAKKIQSALKRKVKAKKPVKKTKTKKVTKKKTIR